MDEPVVNEVTEISFAGVEDDEVVPPSDIGTNVEMLLDGGRQAEPEISPPSHRVTPSAIVRSPAGFQIFAFAGVEDAVRRPPSDNGVIFGMISRISAEAEAEFRRWLNRTPPSASFGIDGDGQESYPATVLSPETGMMFSISGDGLHPPAEFPMLPEGGDGANGDPRLPPPVHRFIRFRIYAWIPTISGTCISILAGIMDPTTINKKLIGVSVISLVGNVATTSWLIFYGGELPKNDWKNISFKSMFVFTGTLTLYASFSTLEAHLFTLPGIVLCGVLAVGLGHSDGLKWLGKKVIATVKNATQKIREWMA